MTSHSRTHPQEEPRKYVGAYMFPYGGRPPTTAIYHSCMQVLQLCALSSLNVFLAGFIHLHNSYTRRSFFRPSVASFPPWAAEGFTLAHWLCWVLRWLKLKVLHVKCGSLVNVWVSVIVIWPVNLLLVKTQGDFQTALLCYTHFCADLYFSFSWGLTTA